MTAGTIVETEAYLGFEDPASHAYRGRRTAGNKGIYGELGAWYVYRSYGVHWCANLVAGEPGLGAAVLLRAIYPTAGITTMRRRRAGARDRNLANGPGKLTQALGMTQRLDGRLMRDSTVRVLPGQPVAARNIKPTPRIGISKATTWLLRYTLDPDLFERSGG